MNYRTLFSGLLLAALLGTGWSWAQQRYTFQRGSSITIEGTSTVHDWHCTTSSITGALDASEGFSSMSTLNLSVPVSGIDCNNGIMNGKLRDALGSSPIQFALTTARVGSPNGDLFGVEANGRLTIKGTSRTQRVNAQGRALSNGRYRFTGSVPITMSQFGVEPPTAMLGTLHTGDRVTVRFDVTVGS